MLGDVHSNLHRFKALLPSGVCYHALAHTLFAEEMEEQHVQVLLSCSGQSLGPFIWATSCGSFKIHPFFFLLLSVSVSPGIARSQLPRSPAHALVLCTPGQVGFQVWLLRLFCLGPHDSARNTHGHPVKPLLRRGGWGDNIKIKKPLWADPRRAKKQNTACVSGCFKWWIV